jgi:hypothetical protein
MSDGTAVDAAEAIHIGDVQVSRVVYHRVTEGAPQVWITFQISGSQRLKLQLGVPFIERLRDYRPALAVLGPGLPGVDLPFAVPEGLGGLLLETDEVAHPEVFDEPFSVTRSWIVASENVELPEPGRYYVVAFDPSGREGKLWVALGREEAFTLNDIAELPEALAAVRRFHEVPEGSGLPCFIAPIGFLAVAIVVRRALVVTEGGTSP